MACRIPRQQASSSACDAVAEHAHGWSNVALDTGGGQLKCGGGGGSVTAASTWTGACCCYRHERGGGSGLLTSRVLSS